MRTKTHTCDRSTCGRWTLCTHPPFLGLHACNKRDAWPMDGPVLFHARACLIPCKKIAWKGTDTQTRKQWVLGAWVSDGLEVLRLLHGVGGWTSLWSSGVTGLSIWWGYRGKPRVPLSLFPYLEVSTSCHPALLVWNDHHFKVARAATGLSYHHDSICNHHLKLACLAGIINCPHPCLKLTVLCLQPRVSRWPYLRSCSSLFF